MARFVILGNSGSGKSTLAARLARDAGCPHLDLDTLAWEPVAPPRRRALADSARRITSFLDAHDRWVIEGCYADLLAVALPRCTNLVFLNRASKPASPTPACVRGSRTSTRARRPRTRTWTC